MRSVSVHGCIYIIFLFNNEKRRKKYISATTKKENTRRKEERKKTTATENNSNDTTTKHSLTYALTKTVLVRCTVCERRDTKYVSLEIHEKRFSFSSPVFFFRMFVSVFFTFCEPTIKSNNSVWKSDDKRSNYNSVLFCTAVLDRPPVPINA